MKFHLHPPHLKFVSFKNKEAAAPACAGVTASVDTVSPVTQPELRHALLYSYAYLTCVQRKNHFVGYVAPEAVTMGTLLITRPEESTSTKANLAPFFFCLPS